jgi:hypothetical protein
MTTTIDRRGSAAGNSVVDGHRRGAAEHAKALSPRLSRQRAEGSGGTAATRATTRSGRVPAAPRYSNASNRTPTVIPARRRRNARAIGSRRMIGRPVVGFSRRGGCAHRTQPGLRACLAIAVGAFLGLVILLALAGFGGARQAGGDSSGAIRATEPVLTSLVTVRAGEDLDQVAAQIAPDRPVAEVTGAIARINGLADGRVRPGQTLVTPRY